MADATGQATAWLVYERLLALHGDHPLIPRREPLHELISTMLSHRTTEANEERAFQQLWRRFGSWEAIRAAPTADVAATIAAVSFAEAKAANLQTVLGRIIDEYGEPSLADLKALSVEEGMAWLTSLPGVGPKTAALVLLFCFAKPILPVDTHVHRVSQRVGLIGPKINPTQAHPLLLALLPRDAPVLFNFHINLLRHGQQICTWAKPKCPRCPLTDICAFYQSGRGQTTESA